MSDERDTDTDVTGGASADDGAGQTVVAAPQRPTGKRTRQRAAAAEADAATEILESGGVEEAGGDQSKKSKDKKGKAKKGGAGGGILAPFKFVFTYLKQVVGELRKVIWPNRKQMSSYTVVVLAFLAFMVALISLADLGLAKLVLLVFG